MSVNTIQFVNFMRRGGDPEKLFQRVAARQTNALEEKTGEVVEALVNKQKVIEEQINPLVGRVESLDITQLGTEALEITKTRVEQFRVSNRQLHNGLEKGLQEVQERKERITSLRGQLTELDQSLHKVPPARHVDALAEFGNKVTDHIGGTKPPALPYGMGIK